MKHYDSIDNIKYKQGAVHPNLRLWTIQLWMNLKQTKKQ